MSTAPESIEPIGASILWKEGPDAAPTAAVTPLRPRLRALRRLLPVAVSALIVGWQLDFNVDTPAPRGNDSMRASSGLLTDLRYFFYFYYHFGVFPVGARDVPRLGPTRRDALDFVEHHGRKLRMDFGETQNTPRFGDYGKLLVLWPDAALRRDPAHASARPFNETLFIVALLAVWWAFWRERRVLLGTLIVVLVGSDPFQLYETYGRANIFSLPISVAMIALAVHLPYLTGRRAIGGGAWAIAFASGVLLATFREIRTEAAIVVLALPAVYLTSRGPWPRRLRLVALLLTGWVVTSHVWTVYWSRGFVRATRFVEAAGGRVFPGRHSYNHALWHAVCCGLGDFGGDRGFVWDDRAAFRWATTRDPKANPRPLTYHYRDGYYFEETYDGVNHVAPTDLPEYNRLVRGRALGAIGAHPLWYGRILLQRAGAILGRATPAALSAGVARLSLPGIGWMLIPVLLLALFLRRAFEAKLILFTLPLSAVALLVYSGRGMTGYGVAHLIALAVGVDLLARAYRARRAEGSHAR